MPNTEVATPVDTAAELRAKWEALIEAGRPERLEQLRRLMELGLVDQDGKQLKTEIPADMLDPQSDCAQ